MQPWDWLHLEFVLVALVPEGHDFMLMMVNIRTCVVWANERLVEIAHCDLHWYEAQHGRHILVELVRRQSRYVDSACSALVGNLEVEALEA